MTGDCRNKRFVAPGTAPNENPCPSDKVAVIKQAFRRFGLL